MNRAARCWGASMRPAMNQPKLTISGSELLISSEPLDQGLSRVRDCLMPIDAKTIQIFLPDGEPRGIRIAEITTRIVQAVQVPRARLDRFLQRPECDHIGVYYLFADPDESAKPV